MYAVEKLSSYITRGVYTVSGPFHPFGGAVDIIVVQQPDGSFKSSPWYVRFGKFQGVLKTREKVVTICVNGVEAGFHMYLDHKGEAYFLKDAESDGDSSSSSFSSGDEKEEKNLIPRIEKSQSCNVDAGAQIVMGRSRSRRSAIFGYMFGRRSMKDNGNDVERMSSMERAEIAADLLEMKWSTNLAMDDRRVDDALGEDVVTADTEGTLQTLPDEKVSSRGEGVDSEEVSVPNSLSLGDDEGIRDASLPSGLSTVDGRKELVDCCDRELMGDSFRVTVDVVSEVHIEKRFTQTPERRIREEIVEITTLETGNLSKRTEVVTESKEFEVSPEGSVLKNGSYNVQSGDSSLNSHDLVQALRESYGASAVEKEGEEVVSIRYTETLERSNEREALDPLFGTHEQCGQQCEGICNTTEMISEVKSQPESSQCKDEEDVDTSQQLSLETSITEDSSLLVKPQADWPSNEAFEDAVANGFCSDSSIIGTGQTHDKETKNLAEEQPSLELIVSVKSQPEMNGIETIADSLDQVQEVVNVGKPFEGESSCISNGIVIAQEVGITPMPVETVKTRVPSSESSEDDQFLFSDIDGFGDNRTNPEQSSNDATVEAVDHTLLYSEGDIEEHEMKSLYDEQSGESIDEMPRTPTSPITIPRTRAHLMESELLIRSVPIIRSHIHDLEASNLLHPLSCSLNMSEKIEQGLPEKEAFKSSDLEADCKSNTLQDHHMPNPTTAVDDEKWEEQKDTPTNPAVGMIDVDRPENNLEGDDAMGDMVPSGGSWKIWPFTFRKSKTITTVRSIPEVTIVADTAQKAKTMKMKEQSLTPTSEELASLNLKEGPNVITFTFSTAMLGRQQVDAMIYLWKWNTHVVISDVDGTITKSDVLGQFMPLVGIDWSQTGVAHLFSAIKENGYQLLFLSARAISQAYITRQFLFNLKQDGKALPDGPVVISPDGLFPSLYREVIRRAPHEFKISCLEGIRALFPPDSNPFYAGFGNRDTDEISYLKVGIPKGKIFIINPKGEVAVNRRVDTKSYSSLHAMVNGMFPPMSSGEQEDFNSWNYWKLPLVGIDA